MIETCLTRYRASATDDPGLYLYYTDKPSAYELRASGVEKLEQLIQPYWRRVWPKKLESEPAHRKSFDMTTTALVYMPDGSKQWYVTEF